MLLWVLFCRVANNRKKPQTLLWSFLVFKMETLQSSPSSTKSKAFFLEFFSAGLVFKGFCAWGCVQGEGENDVVELNLIGKLRIIAGSHASSGNTYVASTHWRCSNAASAF